MVKLDQRSIEQIIIDDLNGPDVERVNREYLGYSSIGDSCMRKLWYSFRWVTSATINGRIERLFSRGDQEEVVLGHEFNRINVPISDDQLEVVGFENHAKGHIDGLIKESPWFDEPVLFEAKTFNLARYKQLIKLKVKQSDYQYYIQAIMYMGKLGLNKTLFIATCKDNDERYVEIIEFDQDIFDRMEEKVESIITTDTPPPKIGNESPTWFECRWCSHKEVCHHNAEPVDNCRTCQYGTIIKNGKWRCADNEDWCDLQKQHQIAGCENYKKLETL